MLKSWGSPVTPARLRRPRAARPTFALTEACVKMTGGRQRLSGLARAREFSPRVAMRLSAVVLWLFATALVLSPAVSANAAATDSWDCTGRSGMYAVLRNASGVPYVGELDPRTGNFSSVFSLPQSYSDHSVSGNISYGGCDISPTTHQLLCQVQIAGKILLARVSDSASPGTGYLSAVSDWPHGDTGSITDSTYIECPDRVHAASAAILCRGCCGRPASGVRWGVITDGSGSDTYRLGKGGSSSGGYYTHHIFAPPGDEISLTVVYAKTQTLKLRKTEIYADSYDTAGSKIDELFHGTSTGSTARVVGSTFSTTSGRLGAGWRRRSYSTTSGGDPFGFIYTWVVTPKDGTSPPTEWRPTTVPGAVAFEADLTGGGVAQYLAALLAVHPYPQLRLSQGTTTVKILSADVKLFPELDRGGVRYWFEAAWNVQGRLFFADYQNRGLFEVSISQAQYDAGTCTLERVGLAHSRPETLSPGYFSTYPQVPFEMQEGPVFNFESGFTCPNAQVPGFLAATCGNHNGPGTGPVSCPGATVYAPYTADRRCTGFGDHPWKDDSSVLARDGRCDACAVGANTRQSEFGWGSPVEYDCSCSVGGCDGDCADCGTCGDRPVYTASGYDSGCDVSQEGKFDHPLCCVSPPIGAINLTVRRVPRPGDAGRVDDKVKVAFSNSLVQALRVALPMHALPFDSSLVAATLSVSDSATGADASPFPTRRRRLLDAAPGSANQKAVLASDASGAGTGSETATTARRNLLSHDGNHSRWAHCGSNFTVCCSGPCCDRMPNRTSHTIGSGFEQGYGAPEFCRWLIRIPNNTAGALVLTQYSAIDIYGNGYYNHLSVQRCPGDAHSCDTAMPAFNNNANQEPDVDYCWKDCECWKACAKSLVLPNSWSGVPAQNRERYCGAANCPILNYHISCGYAVKHLFASGPGCTVPQPAVLPLSAGLHTVSFQTVRRLYDMYGHEINSPPFNGFTAEVISDWSPEYLHVQLHFPSAQVASAIKSVLPSIFSSSLSTGVTGWYDILSGTSRSNRCLAMDLGIVIDRSGSVYENWPAVVNTVHEIIHTLSIGLNHSRVGVVEFDEGPGNTHTWSEAARTILKMNESISNDHVRELLYDRMPTSTGFRTCLSCGIDRLRNEIFQENNGMRPAAEGIPRVAIVISDGIQNMGGDDNTAIAAAELLRTEKDVKLFAIGVAYVRPSTMLFLVGGDGTRVAYGEWSDLADFGRSATTFACDASIVHPPCPADTYAHENKCIDCPDAFTSLAGSTECRLCRAGLTGPEGGPCVPCPAGTDKRFFWSTNCTGCSAGEH